jgi:hypothetical protein
MAAALLGIRVRRWFTGMRITFAPAGLWVISAEAEKAWPSTVLRGRAWLSPGVRKYIIRDRAILTRYSSSECPSTTESRDNTRIDTIHYFEKYLEMIKRRGNSKKHLSAMLRATALRKLES